MGQITAVVSGKGGTGKTAFTALVGTALASFGKKTLVLDGDVGLRDLDIALGLSDRMLMDFTDVIAGRVELDEAVVPHERLDQLYLLTAPVHTDPSLTEEGMKKLMDQVREQFDVCLIDAAAGLGTFFRLATSCADRCVVVSTTEPASLRDAQRTVMELERYPNGSIHLVVNRLSRKLLRTLRSNIDDAMDTAGLPLIGIIPEDSEVPAALGGGKADRLGYFSGARRASRNIARRLTGERVPLLKL